eukprot:TRINITY_DN63_c0_g1_i15.p1 TRINITY_DN63_c0_g1~~TRINITY_DN63_c0_g1_i15.p1  ORF type:complete len:507 (+),score=153.28 TRINITY_DN63_c0_g1_i15:1165-2685(+)
MRDANLSLPRTLDQVSLESSLASSFMEVEMSLPEAQAPTATAGDAGDKARIRELEKQLAEKGQEAAASAAKLKLLTAEAAKWTNGLRLPARTRAPVSMQDADPSPPGTLDQVSLESTLDSCFMEVEMSLPDVPKWGLPLPTLLAKNDAANLAEQKAREKAVADALEALVPPEMATEASSSLATAGSTEEGPAQEFQEILKQERHHNVVLSSRLECLLEERRGLMNSSAQISMKLQKADTERSELTEHNDALKRDLEDARAQLLAAETKQEELLERWEQDITSAMDSDEKLEEVLAELSAAKAAAEQEAAEQASLLSAAREEALRAEAGLERLASEFKEELFTQEAPTESSVSSADAPCVRASQERSSSRQREHSSSRARSSSRPRASQVDRDEWWARRLDEALQAKPLPPGTKRELQEARNQAQSAKVRHDALHERFVAMKRESETTEKMLRLAERERAALTRRVQLKDKNSDLVQALKKQIAELEQDGNAMRDELQRLRQTASQQ